MGKTVAVGVGMTVGGGKRGGDGGDEEDIA